MKNIKKTPSTAKPRRKKNEPFATSTKEWGPATDYLKSQLQTTPSRNEHDCPRERDSGGKEKKPTNLASSLKREKPPNNSGKKRGLAPPETSLKEKNKEEKPPYARRNKRKRQFQSKGRRVNLPPYLRNKKKKQPFNLNYYLVGKGGRRTFTTASKKEEGRKQHRRRNPQKKIRKQSQKKRRPPHQHSKPTREDSTMSKKRLPRLPTHRRESSGDPQTREIKLTSEKPRNLQKIRPSARKHIQMENIGSHLQEEGLH